MEEKYIDNYGIDSLENLKDAVKNKAEVFITSNEELLKDKKELQVKFNIKIISSKECYKHLLVKTNTLSGNCLNCKSGHLGVGRHDYCWREATKEDCNKMKYRINKREDTKRI